MGDWVSSAAVAAVTTFLINYWREHCKEKNRLRVNAYILLTEVNTHIFRIEALIKNNKNLDNDSLKEYILNQTPAWEKIKFELSNIPFEDFKILSNHYRNIEKLQVLHLGKVNLYPAKVLQAIRDSDQTKLKLEAAKDAKKILESILEEKDSISFKSLSFPANK